MRADRLNNTPAQPVTPERRAFMRELAAISDELQAKYGFDSWIDAPAAADQEQQRRVNELRARYGIPVTTSA